MANRPDFTYEPPLTPEKLAELRNQYAILSLPSL